MLVQSKQLAASNIPATAAAALAANQLVTSGAGAATPSLTVADNTVGGASGFVLSPSAQGGVAVLVRSGPLGGFSNLQPGSLYWLGTGGGVAANPPTASGTWTQSIGLASSTSMIDVRLGEAEYNE